MNIEKNSRGTYCLFGKKRHEKEDCPQKTNKIEKIKNGSRSTAIPAVKKGTE